MDGATQRNATQRNATQRNATQRNATWRSRSRRATWPASIVLLMCAAPPAAIAKPAPTPARDLPPPSVVPRGTPSTSTIDAEIAADTSLTLECEQLLASNTKLSAKKRATLLADCKAGTANGGGGGGGVQAMAISYDPSYDHCVDGSKTLCANPDVFHFVVRTFQVTSSAPLTVSTGDLQSIGGSTPDTVLYLVKCDTSACDAGDIVAIDDDIGGSPINWASSITVASPAAGTYAAYVVAYSAARGGLCDLSVSQAGGVNFVDQDRRFSLWKVANKELRTGDVVVAATNPGAPSMTTPGYANYHDSKVLVVSNSAFDCSSNCGRSQFADDTAFGSSASTYMTRMTIGAALGSPTAAKIMVGVYNDFTIGGEYFRMHARLAHMRRHVNDGGSWSGSTAYNDDDSDGVTYEVELQLGTCDDPDSVDGTDVIVEGWNCGQAQDWVDDHVNLFEKQQICTGSSSDARCWRPSDSDHDGLDDGAELFVPVISCDGAPAGPYREATGCTRVNPIVGTCDSGDWCALEPASGDLDSPWFGQDPTVYDGFVEADWLASTNGAIDATTSAHALTAAQQTTLRNMWSVEPGRCWDGSTGSCPGASDLHYRVNLHAYAGSGWLVADDRAEREIIKGGEDAGAVFARSHFFARSKPSLRHYGVLRYGFALHQAGNGWSDWSRSFQWGNLDPAPEKARSAFAHELGHSFGLAHRHGAQTWEVCGPGPTMCTRCALDGDACTSALPNHSCNPAPNAGTAWQENPVPTVMSYQYSGGMLQQQSSLPGSVFDYSQCSQVNLRYSKGLLERRLDEKALDNSWDAGSAFAGWQLRLLTQAMFCYRSLNVCRGGIATFALREGQGGYYGPTCDLDGSGEATTCYFNWNGQLQGPTDTSSALGDTDITAGRWNGDANVTSNREVLEDQDEWARIVSMGRLWAAREPGKAMCLYANTFNGPQVGDDFCGWGETITVEGGMTAGGVNYPIGGCAVAGDCAGAGATCSADPATCSANEQCLSGSCVSGQCACSSDLGCRSGQCVAGACLTYWGSCSCQNDGECPGQLIDSLQCDSGPSPDRCVTARTSSAVVPPQSEGSQPWALGASAAFDGSDDRIKLTGGSNSRLEALSSTYENRFTLHFDFRFDGFQASETAHVLWKSGAFQMTIANGDQIQASVGGHTALVWSGFQRGRWYRAIWSASKNDQGHFLWLRRMDPETGWYADPGDGGGGACVYQTWTSELPSPGDVWLGHDGGSDADLYFHGRVDNVALVNFVATARPSGCTAQQ